MRESPARTASQRAPRLGDLPNSVWPVAARRTQRWRRRPAALQPRADRPHPPCRTDLPHVRARTGGLRAAGRTGRRPRDVAGDAGATDRRRHLAATGDCSAASGLLRGVVRRQRPAPSASVRRWTIRRREVVADIALRPDPVDVPADPLREADARPVATRLQHPVPRQRHGCRPARRTLDPEGYVGRPDRIDTSGGRHNGHRKRGG